MRLQARLLLVVFDEKGQIFRPVILKVARQVLVHVVFGDRDIQVGVQVARVLWFHETKITRVTLKSDLELKIATMTATTSEVFDFEVFGAGLLSQQWVVEHDFGLCFDALIELPHGHVTQALHILAHLIVRLQLQTPLKGKDAVHLS